MCERRPGCVVRAGLLHAPYSRTDIAFTNGNATSTLVQIDPVVLLPDAWQHGAQQWDLPAAPLANDPRTFWL